MKIRTALLLFASAFPLTAQAEIRIRNIDPTPVKVVVTEMGNTQGIIIQPNSAYMVVGPSILIALPGEQPRRANNFEEYTIKNGEMYLSRRTDRGGRR